MRQKNDAADAEAICEAVTRANMRFVPTKTPKQQSCLMLHRTRHLFIREQIEMINSIRAHLAEFGIVAWLGRKVVTELLKFFTGYQVSQSFQQHGLQMEWLLLQPAPFCQAS
jgi:transposase